MAKTTIKTNPALISKIYRALIAIALHYKNNGQNQQDDVIENTITETFEQFSPGCMKDKQFVWFNTLIHRQVFLDGICGPRKFGPRFLDQFNTGPFGEILQRTLKIRSQFEIVDNSENALIFHNMYSPTILAKLRIKAPTELFNIAARNLGKVAYLEDRISQTFKEALILSILFSNPLPVLPYLRNDFTDYFEKCTGIIIAESGNARYYAERFAFLTGIYFIMRMTTSSVLGDNIELSWGNLLEDPLIKQTLKVFRVRKKLLETAFTDVLDVTQFGDHIMITRKWDKIRFDSNGLIDKEVVGEPTHWFRDLNFAVYQNSTDL